MKNLLRVIAILLAFNLAAHFIPPVHAQGASVPLQLTVSPATHAACSVVTGATTFCAASDGLWMSVAGAAFAQVGGAAAGVTSFNGRTGAVVSATGDYSYSQLSTPPTNLSCPIATFSTSGSTSGSIGQFAAGACSIK